MMSDSNTDSNVEEDEKFWDRWRSNTYERKLVKPMKKPLTAPLDLAVSSSDVEKLKAGFRPQSQDDKWSWLIEDENGNLSIHIIRHFVQKEVYILRVAPNPSNDNGTDAKIYSITWEGDMNGVQNDLEQAKKNVVILARVILKCDFETLPQYASETV